MKDDFELFKQFIIENDLETDLGLKDFLYGNDFYEKLYYLYKNDLFNDYQFKFKVKNLNGKTMVKKFNENNIELTNEKDVFSKVFKCSQLELVKHFMNNRFVVNDDIICINYGFFCNNNEIKNAFSKFLLKEKLELKLSPKNKTEKRSKI